MRAGNLTFLIYIFFLFTIIASAQGGGPPPPGLPDEDPVVPIDDHVPVLLAAGIILGYIVSMSRRKS